MRARLFMDATDPLLHDSSLETTACALRLDLRAVLVGSHRIGLSSRALCERAAVPPLHASESAEEVQAALTRLWQTILAERPDPLTPLWIGAAVPPGFYARLDWLGAASDTLEDALAFLCRDCTFVGLRLALRAGARELTVEASHGARDVLSLYATGLILSRLQAATGEPLAPERVELVAADGSEHIDRLAAWLGVRPSFGHARTRIVFSEQSWRRSAPQPEGDPLGPIRSALDAARGLTPPTLEQIAHRLGLTERTFQRRLNQCGVTFRQLLAEQQRERATRLLAQRKLPISQVAFALGYSEQAAFARAFRRWTGQTPRSYRRQSAHQPL